MKEFLTKNENKETGGHFQIKVTNTIFNVIIYYFKLNIIKH